MSSPECDPGGMLVTRVKICGLTNLEDAMAAVEAGAAGLGFVFAESSRKVCPSRVRKIVQVLPPFVATVGVFADAPLACLEQIVEQTGLSLVQLHGRESPDYCASVSRKVIKRIAVHEQDSSETVQSRLDRYDVAGYLLDPGAGDGRTFDWSIAAGMDLRGSAIGGSRGRHLIVAGGLNSDNVEDAVRVWRPYAVDVCSAVEASPGKKCADKMRAFIRALEEADVIHAT